MPNLLRMPIFYVGLILLSLTGWLVARNLQSPQAGDEKPGHRAQAAGRRLVLVKSTGGEGGIHPLRR